MSLAISYFGTCYRHCRRPYSIGHRRDFSVPVANKNAPLDSNEPEDTLSKRIADGVGISMGPISLSFSDDFSGKISKTNDSENEEEEEEEESSDADASKNPYGKPISSMTTSDWRENFEKDGTVDLFIKEEFNAGSRLIGGREEHLGGTYGIGTGEGPSKGQALTRSVRIHNHYNDSILNLQVPEDRYVLWEAEDNGMKLPYACRMGCCTACAVRVVSGDLHQPEALGISKRLKEYGYGLMCVGYPRSDLVLETVSEDEVYDLQFGYQFEDNALNKTGPNVVRDDFAFELSDMDE